MAPRQPQPYPLAQSPLSPPPQPPFPPNGTLPIAQGLPMAGAFASSAPPGGTGAAAQRLPLPQTSMSPPAPSQVATKAFNSAMGPASQMPSPAASAAPAARPRSSSGAQRVDPAQIPSPLIVESFPEASQSFASSYAPARSFNTSSVLHVASTGTPSGLVPSSLTSSPTVPVPPTSRIPCSYVDDGNASARYMRPTLWQLPERQVVLQNCGLPLGISLHPFADYAGSLPDDPPTIPLVASEPVRCERCDAYICPWTYFGDGGKKWSCSICGFANKTKAEYFGAADANGRRFDEHQRPELCRGVVEYQLPFALGDASRGVAELPKAVATILVLEATTHTFESTFFRSVIDTLANLSADLSALRNVAVITFNTLLTIHGAKEAFVLAETEEEPSFVPVPPSKLFFERGSDVPWTTIYDRCAASTMQSEATLGSALRWAHRLLDGGSGRIVLFAGSQPKIGVGKLVLRTLLEHQPQLPGFKFYETLAESLCKQGVAVDAVLGHATYMDVPTLRVLFDRTGGRLRDYFPFDSSGCFLEPLAEDIRRVLLGKFAQNCLLAVRCSRGFEVAGVFGCGMTVSSGSSVTIRQVALMDSDQSLQVGLKMASAAPGSSQLPAVFQVAVFFDQCHVRVFTLRLTASGTTPSALFRATDMDAVLAYLYRSLVLCAADSVRYSSVVNPAANPSHPMNDALVGILAAYRKHCTTNPSPGQLILPEALKTLPAFINALTKAEQSWSAAERMEASRCPIQDLYGLIYPAVFKVQVALSPAGSGLGTGLEDMGISLVRPSSENISTKDASVLFLIQAGQYLFLYSPANSFPFQSPLGTRHFSVPEILQPTSLGRLIRALAARRSHPLRFRLVRAINEDPFSGAVRAAMVEDRQGGCESYVEYLCGLHRHIQNRMQKDVDSMLPHMSM